jgi:hypothetical protein
MTLGVQTVDHSLAVGSIEFAFDDLAVGTDCLIKEAGHGSL